MGAGFKMSAMIAAIYLSLSLYQSLIAVIVVLLVIVFLLIAALVSMYKKYRVPKHQCSIDSDEVRRIDKALQKWVADKRYRECDINRETVASQLNTSKELLNAYFCTVIQKDFNTWRTILRVEDAKTILHDNKELPINLIAEMVGFSDRSNFHRQFTKIVGCTPKQWRDCA